MSNEKQVLLFLGKGFDDLEAAAFIDICGWTSYRTHLEKINVITTGFHDEIPGRYKLTIKPDIRVDDIECKNYQAFAVPGGFHSYGYDEAYDERIQVVAQEIHSAGGVIATMCVGILPIAKSGLLRNRKATTYPLSRHRNNPQFLQRHGCIYTGASIEEDDRIISCAGPAQSIDVVVKMIELLSGEQETKKLCEYIQYARVAMANKTL
jgi:4-methyl-5(b-hydroxyethyl)-thiazole monophosphate biosynthesis